ncbi:MAG: efflux RND transporter permease subunit [Pseudomonadota bacterium]
MINALENVLRRPRTVFTMMLVMIMAGIVSYVTIPKEANPDIDVPIFYVSIAQQGISPEDAERLLVRPMETKLRGLDGLKEITGIASEGHAGIVLEFNIDFNKEEALADIRDKVDQGQADLPEDAEEPTITETNFSLQPTIFVTLSGNVPERTLYQHARRLKDEIEAVSTVLEANLTGHREELLEVIIDLMKLESYNISQQELVTAITQNNQLVAAGFLDTGKGRFNVKVPGLIEGPKDVANLVIKQSGEGVVTLRDVADIRRTFKDPSVFTRVNGEPAIAIEVVKRIGTNIIENNRDVRAVVGEFTKDWPAPIKINYLLDQSNFIFEVLGSLQSSIMTAIALVMIVIVAALGLKSALLVGIAIPASFMVGFLILGLLGMTVNMMVMFGLVLTVGMLVDGAIVVVEYADRKIAEGMPENEAYIRAARLMFWPIVSSTATTLAAFLPMLLWPGVPGEFMSYLPIMVIIVLSASLLTAMVFLPVTGALLGRVFSFIGHNAAIIIGPLAGIGIAYAIFTIGSQVLFDDTGAASLRNALPVDAADLAFIDPFIGKAAIGLFGIMVGLVVGFALYVIFKWLRMRHAVSKLAQTNKAHLLSASTKFEPKKIGGATGLYVRALTGLAGTTVGNILVIGAVVTLCTVIAVNFMHHATGVEFFVDEEPEQAVVLVSARGNFSVSEARDLVSDVERQVLQVTGVRNVVMSAFPSGGSSGGPQVVGGVQDKPADVIGELNVELSAYCCRRAAVEIFREIRERTQDLAGIKIEIREIEGGPPTGKDVRLQINGTDYDTVRRITGIVRDHVETMEGLRDIEDERPLPGIEWRVSIDREEAGRYNAGISSVGAMIQLVTNGVLIGTYRPNDSEDEVDIRVRLPEEQRTLARLDELRIRTTNGLVPLANFVERTAEPKVSSIIRKDGFYMMNVKANVLSEQGVTPDEKVAELDAWLKSQTWPESISFRFRGADEEQKESGEFLVKAMVGSLFLMFIILVTQFNSFYQTGLTLLTVVLSVFGVLVGMMVTGQKFSIIMTGTGVVALAGIVVNNAIVLIDTYNRMLEEGVEPVEAVMKTAAQRIRPVLLTTITTIAGLVPMAVEINLNFIDQVVTQGGITSIWWVQLSTAIIFGLAFSTILTLVLIPTLLAMPHVWMRAGRKAVGLGLARTRRFGIGGSKPKDPALPPKSSAPGSLALPTAPAE